MTTHAGKVILITGAAGNLGRAVATAFAERGASLVLADYSTEGLEAIPESGLKIQVDLTSEASTRAMVAETVKENGQIDVLANIAGGFSMGPMLHETDAADWEFMMNLNARSVFYTSKAVIPPAVTPKLMPRTARTGP